MPKRDMTGEQIKALILNELVLVGAYGKHHVPVDQIKSWIQNKIKKNGKTVTRCIDDLAKTGLIVKTARNTIHADHQRLDEIFDYIDKHHR